MKLNQILLNKLARHFTICSVFLLIIFCEACSSSVEEDALDSHEDVFIKIDPERQTNPLNNSQYSIDSVRSLSMPANKIFQISKLIVKDNRIYILDSEIARTVFVFDTTGRYLYKLGERGRALSEYIGRPVDFFVDKHNDVHVFDRGGQKIIVFKKDGNPTRVIGTSSSFPYTFGLIDHNNYAYCVQCPNPDKKNNTPALLISDITGENTKNILYLRNTYTYIPSERMFFKNGDRLSHIPIMSDSVLVFKNDSIEKVIHFDFKGKFLTKVKPELATANVTSGQKWDVKGLVWGLLKYQETDSLSMLEYLYGSSQIFWLKNKKNGQIINARSIIDGICPFTYYYLRGNQIVAFIDEEFVKAIRANAGSEITKKQLSESCPQINDIFEGKIPTPAIFYISIR